MFLTNLTFWTVSFLSFLISLKNKAEAKRQNSIICPITYKCYSLPELELPEADHF